MNLYICLAYVLLGHTLMAAQDQVEPKTSRKEKVSLSLEEAGTYIRVITISRTTEACYFMKATEGVALNNITTRISMSSSSGSSGSIRSSSSRSSSSSSSSSSSRISGSSSSSSNIGGKFISKSSSFEEFGGDLFGGEGLSLGKLKDSMKTFSMKKIVETPECPSGQLFLKGKCALFGRSASKDSCPSGYSLYEQRCVIWSEAKCKPKFDRVGDTCVYIEKDSSSAISTGVKEKRIGLICPTGFQHFMHLCAKFAESIDGYQCPAGYVRSQGKCLIWEQTSCPPDYDQDGDECVYSKTSGGSSEYELQISNEGRQGNKRTKETQLIEITSQKEKMAKQIAPICPPGFQFFMHLCAKFAESLDGYKCPAGFVRSQGKCVIWEQASCPPNYDLNGDECVYSKSTFDQMEEEKEGSQQGDKATEVVSECPEGYEKEGNLCYQICPKGFKRYFSNLCISETKDCPPGFTNNGKGDCIMETCPPGLIDSGASCTENCPAGYTNASGVCLSKSTKCPEGYELQGKLCYRSSCPPGFVRFQSGCISESYIKCNEGYELFDTICRRCVTQASGACQKWDLQCSNGWYKVSDTRCAATCPQGTGALGLHCVGISTTGCPEGTLRIRGQGCHTMDQCPQNYEQVGQECVYKVQEECKKLLVNGVCEDHCPNGYVEYGNGCYAVTQTGCPQGFFLLDDRFCVPTCPSDFTTDYKDRKCVSTKTCGNLLAYGDTCVSQCPSHMRPDSSNKMCIIRENLCAGGQFYLSGSCVSSVSCSQIKARIDSNYGVCLPPASCKPGVYIFGPYCLTRCPLGYEALKDTCIVKVQSQCPNGVMHDGHCVNECPFGYVARFGVCVTVTTIGGQIDIGTIQVEEGAIAADLSGGTVACGLNMESVPCSKDEKCKNKCICKPDYEQFETGTFCLPVKKVCKSLNPLDIVFIVDVSQGNKNTNISKQYLSEALSHIYATNKKSIQVGSVLVGKKNLDLTYLHNHESRCSVTNALLTFGQSENIGKGRDTSLSDGIRAAREFVLSQCNGARLGVSRMMIVVSTDIKGYNPNEIKQIGVESDLCSQIGHRIAFVTIGNLTDLPSTAYNFPLKNVDELMSMSDKPASMVCHDFKCPAGYEKVNDECVDVNECTNSPCHISSVCINEPGSFKCYCAPGQYYVDHEQGCHNETKKCDVEAKEICDVVQCVGEAKCVSHNGMGYCSCSSGYVYSATEGCVDHNECSQSPCLDNAICLNTNGSFECQCSTGYQYNRHFGCVDVDECKTLESPCSGNGRCRNLVGSYHCVCKKGYEYIEKEGCKDIDECQRNPQLCVGDKVKCKNTKGSYKCVCPNGYAYTQSGCRDIDECAELGAEAVCGKGSQCTNQEPGYACTCPKGYIHDAENKECILDKALNAIERKLDLVFVVDLSDKMKVGNKLDMVKVFLANLIESYRIVSSNINTLMSLIVTGGSQGDATVVVTAIVLDKANDTINSLTIQGGSTDHVKGLNSAETIINEHGRKNSSKIIYLITASELPADTSLGNAFKEKVSATRKLGQLYLIDFLEPNDRSRWLKLFTEDDLAEMLFMMDADFWKTMYKLIYTRSISKVACPNGFILLDNICQYASLQSKYCKFDHLLYAINTTWTNQCASYQCTEEGVKVLERKCLGYDGECYGEKEFFPALVGGSIKWQAQCQTLSSKDSATGKLQQMVTLLVIEFDREKAQKEAETEDGKQCQFPFKFSDKWYYACTDMKSSARWCSRTQIYDKKYSYCKRTVLRQCVVNGTVYKEGEVWKDGCNDFYCQAGSVRITAKCKTSEGKCVSLMQTNYPCIVGNQEYDNCICLQDSRGYGSNSIVGSVKTEETVHETELLVVCENKVTGEQRRQDEEWESDCFKMKCDDGEAVVLSKGCKSSKNECMKPGSTNFACSINGKAYEKCSCEATDGEQLMLTASIQGQTYTERSGGQWKSSWLSF